MLDSARREKLLKIIKSLTHQYKNTFCSHLGENDKQVYQGSPVELHNSYTCGSLSS